MPIPSISSLEARQGNLRELGWTSRCHTCCRLGSSYSPEKHCFFRYEKRRSTNAYSIPPSTHLESEAGSHSLSQQLRLELSSLARSAGGPGMGSYLVPLPSSSRKAGRILEAPGS